MIKIKYFCIIFYTIFITAKAEIKTSIVGKVGNEIITEIDLKNEIKTILILSKNEINQTNIKKAKDVAVKSIVSNLIKLNEIKKYKIESYSELDLENKLISIAKRYETNKEGLESIFLQNNTSIKPLVTRLRTELKWNSLIYSLYSNQLNINTIDIDNDLREKLKETNEIKEYKLSEIVVSLNNSELEITVKKIYELINKEGFESAVKKFSISSTTQDKGNAGWFAEDILSSNYLKEIKTVKKGDVTLPIKNNKTLTVLKVTDIKSTKKNELNVEKMKKNIIDNKKNKKLNLYSRSHLSKLENSILIDINE